MIVSVSRRCDIPRFQFKWFIERLDAGFCEVVNPFNANQIRRVSLLPARANKDAHPEGSGVDVFVFWTRDPQHILANEEELKQRGFLFYAMVTVTGYPALLEPSMVSTAKVVTAMKELARKIGPDRVIWRYDPILLSNITGEEFHRRNFKTLALNLEGSVRRVIISIYNEYRGSKQRFEGMDKANELRLIDTGDGLAGLLADLAKSAKAAGMEIQSCASKEDFSTFGIKPGACIDAELIAKFEPLAELGAEIKSKDKNQRPHCLCCKSVDIGTYRSCPAGCVYCYAW